MEISMVSCNLFRALEAESSSQTDFTLYHYLWVNESAKLAERADAPD